MATRVVLASANPKKAAELTALLEGRVEVVPRPLDLGEVDETGETLEENATLKARAVAAHAGARALSDDTGLFVDALGGRPGVHSARYAGGSATDADNVDKLLAELAAAGALEPQARRARFRTVLALAQPDGRVELAAGVCEGWIATEPRGAAHFGYDPVFVPADGDGRTFAEMAPGEKAAISHRARALAAAVPLLLEG